MLSFIGEYNCKADSKFRVAVPVVFRRVLTAYEERVWVLRRSTFDACLDMYPMNVWNTSLSLLKEKLNPFNKEHACFFREFCRGTQIVESDANGRVLLPKNLLDSVGIEKEMVFVGADNKIQIWNSCEYEKVAMGSVELGILAQKIFKD